MGLLNTSGCSKLSKRTPKGMRMVNIGDSITDDYWPNIGPFAYYPVPNPANHWTHIVARELECEMINTGIAGDTALNIVANRLQTGILNHSPTHVTLECGGNDIYGGAETLSAIVGYIETIVQTCLNNNIIPILMWFPISVNPQGGASIAQQQDYLTRIPALLKAYAASVNVIFVDFQNTVLGTGYTVNKDYYIPDGIHPSTAGHNIIAKYLLDVFDKNILPPAPVDPVIPPTGFVTVETKINKDWQGGTQYDYETIKPTGSITGIGVKGQASLISLTAKKINTVTGDTYSGNTIQVAGASNSITLNPLIPLKSVDYNVGEVFNGNGPTVTINMPINYIKDNMLE